MAIHVESVTTSRLDQGFAAEPVEAELQRARELLWTASHDLCTPLGVIEMCAQALLRHCADGAVPDRGRLVETLAQIERLAKTAAALVTDVLAVEKLATRTHPLSSDAPEVDVEMLLADVVGLHVGALERARCSVFVRRTEGTERARARCDAQALRRVFSNLLQNVIRHAPGSPVHIEFARLPTHLRIRFADGGPGPSDEGVRAMAQPFLHQGLQAGHGLGLWIVQRAVAEMGGRIQAWRGPGMAFEIELPA